MGYTHYWSMQDVTEIPQESLIILREILNDGYVNGIIQYESNIHKAPVLTERKIRFNGCGSDGHETFVFNVDDTYRTYDGHHFAFCKTARKPYDEIVMQVLIVLKHFLKGRLKVTSDGGFRKEWAAVRRAMEAKYNIITYVDE